MIPSEPQGVMTVSCSLWRTSTGTRGAEPAMTSTENSAVASAPLHFPTRVRLRAPTPGPPHQLFDKAHADMPQLSAVGLRHPPTVRRLEKKKEKFAYNSKRKAATRVCMALTSSGISSFSGAAFDVTWLAAPIQQSLRNFPCSCAS